MVRLSVFYEVLPENASSYFLKIEKLAAHHAATSNYSFDEMNGVVKPLWEVIIDEEPEPREII